MRITCLSVDVFDTFLLRNCKPEFYRFYEITCLQFNVLSKVYPSLSKSNFYYARCTSHYLTYRTMKKNKNSKEARIIDIYSNMMKIMDLNCDKKLIEELINIELNYEVTNLKLNSNLYAKINKILNNNKGALLIFLSDMYLSEFNVKRIITKFLNIQFNYALHVSSNYNLSKSSGDMYDYVVSNYNLDKNSFLHMGDNYVSDYLIPTNKGIKSNHTPRIFLIRFLRYIYHYFYLIKLKAYGYL